MIPLILLSIVKLHSDQKVILILGLLYNDRHILALPGPTSLRNYGDVSEQRSWVWAEGGRPEKKTDRGEQLEVRDATRGVLEALAEPGPLAWPFVKKEVKRRCENHLGPLKGSKIQPVWGPLLHILCKDTRETAELHINYEYGLKQQAFCSVYGVEESTRKWGDMLLLEQTYGNVYLGSLKS